MSYCYPYPRPAVTVDAVVFSLVAGERKVLLIQRKNLPFQNQWALPGGFVDMEETVENAVRRELKEETGLSLDTLEQFKVYSDPLRDPRGRTISIVFAAVLSEQLPEIIARDDAKAVAWFSLDKIPSLAFDHELILKETILKYMS